MPRWRKPTGEEIRARRKAVADKARSGELRLPEAIGEMRHAVGLSQADFAKLFRMTTRQVGELERGEANPTIETLNRIGCVFGFDVGFVPRRQAGPEVAGDRRRSARERRGKPVVNAPGGKEREDWGE